MTSLYCCRLALLTVFYFLSVHVFTACTVRIPLIACGMLLLLHVIMLSADQVYGDQEMNTVVRNHCMDYMVSKLLLCSCWGYTL